MRFNQVQENTLKTLVEKSHITSIRITEDLFNSIQVFARVRIPLGSLIGEISLAIEVLEDGSISPSPLSLPNWCICYDSLNIDAKTISLNSAQWQAVLMVMAQTKTVSVSLELNRPYQVLVLGYFETEKFWEFVNGMETGGFES